MSFLRRGVFSLFLIPLKIHLKICGFVVFVALILISCVYFLDIDVSLNFYQNPNENSWKSVPVSKIYKISKGSVAKKDKIKTILYWTKMFNDENFYFGKGDIFKNCEVNSCRATSDREFMDIEDFDALLFHGFQIKPSDLPPARSGKQKYIFANLESPITYPLTSITNMDGFYNWTMTYRGDSDIPRTYGYIVDSVTGEIAYPLWARSNNLPKHENYEDLRSAGNNVTYAGKRKAVAWFVSHCGTAGLRDVYVTELQKYIDVDIYGKCGPLSCPARGDNCYKMLESDYYFYLSFENSLCQDYVTEKLYEVMKYDVVPIVYGGVNYSEFTLPGSYIDVQDYESPKQLAQHLRNLMSNPKEYAQFFWWKKQFSIDRSHRVCVCLMCKLLHNEESLAPSSIKNLKKWWVEGKCLNPADFLKKINQ